MKARSARRSWTVAVTAMGFLAGAIVMAFVDRGFPHAVSTAEVPRPQSVDIAIPVRVNPAATSSPVIEAEPLADLRGRHLELPVQGVSREALRDSFDETRGSARSHEAIDIMAPRHTPVVAVEGGTIARLFESKAGGITVYQFDPSIRYAYYYAHLERYADGLQEGDVVQRGHVLGYVGTSGNAPKGAPHLHFAVFRLTDKKQWWNGSPIDPYDVLK
jgi:peptidoglycan LD-endopeptidase LytH